VVGADTYRRLNWAKFGVIRELEKRLPVKPYTDEWRCWSREGIRASFAGSAWYAEATFVEQVVLLVFAGTYIVLGVRVWLR
jgi:hypothetical protein